MELRASLFAGTRSQAFVTLKTDNTCTKAVGGVLVFMRNLCRQRRTSNLPCLSEREAVRGELSYSVGHSLEATFKFVHAEFENTNAGSKVTLLGPKGTALLLGPLSEADLDQMVMKFENK